MERLIEQFKPTHLYAYDPNPLLTRPPRMGATRVKLFRAAAWTYTGTIGYQEHGPWSYLTDDPQAPRVSCVDLAETLPFLSKQHPGALVLKLDCEGAEYVLLPHLIDHDVDTLLDLILVEWHPYGHPFTKSEHSFIRAAVEANVRCEMREWCF